MRLLMFVSALGILVSIAVLIFVIIKARKDENPPKVKPSRHEDN